MLCNKPTLKTKYLKKYTQDHLFSIKAIFVYLHNSVFNKNIAI